MNKKIYLIGLNLYSIFLALKIRSKDKKNPITIIEASPNFINAYKRIKIKKYILNPGFHALEDVRSKKLIKIISKGIKLKKINKTRGILIGKNLISYLDSYDKWPKSIINKFNIKRKYLEIEPTKYFKHLNKKYLIYLKNNYLGNVDNINNTLSTSYPWFFPTNYNIKSEDEAAIFDRKVRQKKVRHAFVFPKKGHFSEISNVLKKNLNKNKIKIKLNTPIKFSKINKNIIFEGYKNIQNINHKKIICIPVKPLYDSIKRKISNKSYIQRRNTPNFRPIKYYTGLIEINNYTKNDLDKFCEIIVSSEFAFGLRRISQYSDVFNIKNKKIFQIEFTEHSSEKNINKQIKNIIKLLTNFVVFKKTKTKENIKLIGYSWVRDIYRPNKSHIKKMTTITNNFFKNIENTVFPRKITWPINSNKHLLYAEEDYKKKITKFLNDKR